VEFDARADARQLARGEFISHPAIFHPPNFRDETPKSVKPSVFPLCSLTYESKVTVTVLDIVPDTTAPRDMRSCFFVIFTHNFALRKGR